VATTGIQEHFHEGSLMPVPPGDYPRYHHHDWRYSTRGHPELRAAPLRTYPRLRYPTILLRRTLGGTIAVSSVKIFRRTGESMVMYDWTRTRYAS